MKRIRHIILLPLLILALTFRLQAQSIVLCEAYDAQGTASGIYSTWEIDAGGAYVYLLYNQTYALESGIWYLYIDYDWDNVGTYGAYETLSMTPEAGKNWYVYDYKFKDTGKYRAYIMHDGIELASTTFEIDYKPGVSAIDTTKIDTYYYENSNIVFCTSVDDEGNPVDESSSFSLGSGGSVNVAVYIDNDRMPFKTNKLFVDIYKDADAAIFDSFGIDIQPEWDYVKFTQNFTEPGTYTVEFYTADDIYINTSDTLSITQ